MKSNTLSKRSRKQVIQNKTNVQNNNEIILLKNTLDAVIGSSFNAIITISPEGIIVDWNKAAEKIYGYKAKEVIGKHITIIYPQDRLHEFDGIKKKLFQGKKIQQYPTKRVKKNLTIIDVILNLTPILDKTGKIIAAAKTTIEITATKQTEYSLLQYSQTIMQSPVSVMIADHNGNLEFVNPKFTEITGYTPEEVKGKNPRFLKSGFTKPDVYKKLWNTIKSGKIWRGEFQNKKKNGDLFWEKASISPVKDAYGKITHFLAIKEDITNKKILEAELEEERKRWKGVVEGIADEVWLCDKTGKMSLINLPSVTKMGLEEFKDKSLNEILNEVDILYTNGKMRPLDQAPLLRSLKGEIVRGEEIMRHRKTGKTKFRHFSSAPMRDAKGEITGAVAIVRDISAEKHVEKALKESERRYKTLAEVSPDCIKIFDRKGNLLYLNKAGLREHRLKDLSDLKHWDIFSCIIKENHLKFKDAFKKALKGYETTVEIKHTYEGSTREYCLLTLAPIFNEKHMAEYIFGVSRDITDLKKLEHQKDEFISIASHEIKTPLTSQKAYMQLINARLVKNKNDKLQVLFEKALYQTDKITKLVNDLLDVSRIQAGKFQFEDSVFNFDDLVSDVVSEMQLTTEKQKIYLEGATRQSIFADKDRIAQVFFNLLSNAIKYSNTSDKIFVNISNSHNKIMVKIQDFGVGIPKYMQEKIFERFFRANTQKNTIILGLGLGLYISLEIIKRQGGKLWVESEEGQGSCFYFTLPVNKKTKSVSQNKFGIKKYQAM